MIHPKKEAEDVRLTMASIVGSAKATQEADLVMLLQVNNKPCHWCVLYCVCALCV